MSLWDKIDETTPNDSDYIWTGTRGDESEVKLSTISTPLPASGNTVRVRAAGIPAPMIARVPRMRQPLAFQRPNQKWLDKGLTFLFTPSGGQLLDVVSGKVAVSSGVTLVGTSEGVAARLSGGYIEWTGVNLPRPHTLFVFCKLNSATTTQALISAGTASNWRVLYVNNASGSWTFEAGAWDGAGYHYYGGGTPQTATPTVLVATFTSSDTSAVYVDGVLNNSIVNPGSMWPDPADRITIGAQGAHTQNASMDVYAAAGFSGVLTAADVQDILRNRWQLFAPETRITFPRPILTTKLVQGTTVKATWTDGLTPVAQTFQHALTSGESSSITDGADLRLRFRVD